MELLYKKRNLKFGFHKEIQKKELKFSREASRLKRFSLLRDIDMSNIKENKNEEHKLGEKKTGIPSRTEMLKKWKEEKTIKRQKELEKKVATKPGFCLKKPSSKRSESANSEPNTQSLKNVASRTGLQNIKLAPTVSKSISQPTPTKPSVMLRKPAASVLKSTSTVIQSHVTQKTVISKSASLSKSTVQKPSSLSLRTTALQNKSIPKETVQKLGQSSLSSRTTQGKSIPKEAKPSFQSLNAQSSKVVTTSRIATKNATTVSKVTQKLPLTKSKPEKDVISTNVPFAAKSSKVALPNRFKEPSSRALTKKNQTTQIQKKGIDDKESKPAEIFSCDISTIEPSVTRKSFAPQNFMFCPPSEWNFPFENDVSSPTFLMLRSNGMQRTSSPLKSDDLKASTDDLSTMKMKDSSFDHNLLEEKRLEEKMKASLVDNECQSSEPSIARLEMKKDILKIKVEDSETTCNRNIAVPDLVTQECSKVTSSDIDIEKFLESGVEGSPLNDLPSLLNKPVSPNNVEDNPSFCVFNLSKNRAQDLETIRCPNFESSKYSEMDSFELIDSHKLIDASENIPTMIVPNDKASKNNAEPDSYDTSLKNTSLQNISFETMKVATSKTTVDNNLISIESDDLSSYKPVNNDNKIKAVPTDLLVSLENNLDCQYSEVSSSGQNPDLKAENCITPKMCKSQSVSSSSSLGNGLDGLLIDNECSLNEPLKNISNIAPYGKVSTRQRKSKMPPRYTLESINESLESKGTPQSLKKQLPLFDENFTPRRSARLSEKLDKSGSFECRLKGPEMILDLENIEPKTRAIERITNGTPVSCKKESKKDFTPRRSQRISDILRKSSSYENLFDVRRPSVMVSPSLDDLPLKGASRITYDFDNLHLENSPEVIKKAIGRPHHSKKASLLYTPPTRRSIPKSVKEDLMSFSPV